MTTILADTFTASLARLGNDEQKQAKLSAFDLQTDPDRPGLQFHRIDKSKDANFWSIRVSRDLRIIVHKTGDSTMLCYVGHHDDAYGWAERRRIDAHPRTGALQIVEVRERVEAMPPAAGTAPGHQPQLDLVTSDPGIDTRPLFSSLSNDDLLSIGVPEDWLGDVHSADEQQFFTLAKHLPQEASEALLDYAANGVLTPAPAPVANPLQHPDTLRRLRVVDGAEELQAALDAPFEKWTVFLHPSQRGIVERSYSGPARTAGSAGTGKTVVALHRVQRLLRENPNARVLLTSFSDELARNLEGKLKILFGDRPAQLQQVTVASFDAIAAELYALTTGRKPNLVADDILRSMLGKAAEEAETSEVTPQFLLSEWTNVIDSWQIDSAAAYAEVPRMGRKSRLGPKQRQRLWQVFGAVRENLARRVLMTKSMVFAADTARYRYRSEKPFTHIVVDEAQDLGVGALRFLSAIAPESPEALFFAGDLGQRIFQQPFSWKQLGVDVRGRSSTLRVNYRTSHQIRRAADRLLPETIRDVDGLEDRRAGTISVFEGPDPEIIVAATQGDEQAEIAERLKVAIKEGFSPSEIAIFVRSKEQLSRGRAAVEAAGLQPRGFVDRNGANEDTVLVGIMHLAKGLEFRLVVVMACDENVLPLAERVDDVADAFELDEVITTERQLLYVAATRARDRLILSATAPASEFLDDFSAVE